MKAKKKFIRAGSSRKAFSLGNGHYIKIPIRERFATGKLQNKYEALNLEKYSEYSCFPKIYGHNKNYSRIEVEECLPVDNYSFHGYLYETLDINDINAAPRLDGYKNISIDSQYTRWLAFVFGGFMDFLLTNQAAVGIDITDFVTFKIAVDTASSRLKNEADAILNAKSEPMYKVSLQVSKFLNWLCSPNYNNIKKSFRDLIDFYIKHGKESNFLFADLWNITQWGQRKDTYEFVVVDVGYSVELSKSEHYSNKKTIPLSEKIVLTEPGTSPNTFNGEKLSNIQSPNGASVSTKFYTKSEYILAEDGMSRHIKHLGLPDDGLWWWTDKMTFMPYDSLKQVMQTINDNRLTAIKIGFNDNALSVNSIGDNGRWQEKLKVTDVSYKPVLGWRVCEFTFDCFKSGDTSGILKKYHPGHDVTYIEDTMQCV